MTESPTRHRFDAEVSSVLHLMIHALYTNSDIFLRELISNAADACDKLRFEALSNQSLLEDSPELSIAITLDREAKTVTITDNGIGMNAQELQENLGTIARSGTREFAAKLTGDSKKDASLIGQFGVGFYSSFMVADKVAVISRKAGEKQAHRWESDGKGDFTLEPVADETPRGTAITLHLREESAEYADPFRLKHIAHTYSEHVSVPIRFSEKDGEIETLNEGSALWTRPQKDISQEQYLEFYHHVAHSPDEPWMTLHNRVEGALSYTNLLFIPSKKPFDLFHPDRATRVKLYVKRVFITEDNIDIIPRYLRFLRGIVDSDDLPLNISRETLQSNRMVAAIRDAIVKKVLKELEKKAKKAPEEYLTFWNNFGAVLKEGLCEINAPKEEILSVCRFESALKEGPVSLDDYLADMAEGQEMIYYITGESASALRNHPQLEGFKRRGVDVLLLADHVDDFWVNVANDYKEKRFKSVTRVGDELETLGKAEEKLEEKAEEPKESPEQIDTLIARIKSELGEKVSDVRRSFKLSDSPVCLAVPETGMDMRMERFLAEQRQLAGRSAPILEINPTHPVIARLAERVQASGNDAELGDAIWLLFDQARIIEGEGVEDPAGFSRRLTQVMQKSWAA